MIDTQIKQSRTFFYNLIKETFIKEPDKLYFDMMKELVTSLKNLGEEFDDLAFVTDAFGEIFQNYTLDDLKDEYNRVFVDPFNDNLLNLTASYYIHGKNLGKTLAEIREFIWNMNLVKDEKIFHSEDSVGFLCDVMSYLIENACTQTQTTFFERFIEPFFSRFAKALKENELSNYYACFGKLINFVLDTEKSFLEEQNLIDGGSYGKD